MHTRAHARVRTRAHPHTHRRAHTHFSHCMHIMLVVLSHLYACAYRGICVHVRPPPAHACASRTSTAFSFSHPPAPPSSCLSHPHTQTTHSPTCLPHQGINAVEELDYKRVANILDPYVSFMSNLMCRGLYLLFIASITMTASHSFLLFRQNFSNVPSIVSVYTACVSTLAFQNALQRRRGHDFDVWMDGWMDGWMDVSTI